MENKDQVDEYGQHWNEVPRATHVVVIADQGATLLCKTHTEAMHHTCTSAQVQIEVYEIPPEEEPVACQACHLVEVNRPKIVLH